MSIEAMKQAIEAWDACGRYPDATSDIDSLDVAINALRTAIQQAEAQQPATGEPVAGYVLNQPSTPPSQAQSGECTRSHPHEEMSQACVLRTEIARLRNAAK